jgi:hypothetical protein
MWTTGRSLQLQLTPREPCTQGAPMALGPNVQTTPPFKPHVGELAIRPRGQPRAMGHVVRTQVV